MTAEELRKFFQVSQGRNPNKITSVFDTGYIATSKARDFTNATTGIFRLIKNPDKSKGVKFRKVPVMKNETIVYELERIEENKDTRGLVDPYWRIAITQLEETHEENYKLHNTVSDNVVIYAMGAKPIMVTITGFVLISSMDDDNYLLLRNYVENYRARNLVARNMELEFLSQDTKFNIIVESINLGRTIELETYVHVAISGMAYNYGQVWSTEKLSLAYYGDKYKYPTSDKEMETAEEKAEKKKKEEEALKARPPFIITK